MTLRICLIAACLAALSACTEKPTADTVESLLANPERLKNLRAQCKADHAEVGVATCNAVAEATRRRFMGSGTPYTPSSPRSPSSSAATASAPPKD